MLSLQFFLRTGVSFDCVGLNKNLKGLQDWRAKRDPKAKILSLQSFLRKCVPLGYGGSMVGSCSLRHQKILFYNSEGGAQGDRAECDWGETSKAYSGQRSGRHRRSGLVVCSDSNCVKVNDRLSN